MNILQCLVVKLLAQEDAEIEAEIAKNKATQETATEATTADAEAIFDKKDTADMA